MELIRGEGWGGGGEFGPEMLTTAMKKGAAPLDFEEGFGNRGFGGKMTIFSAGSYDQRKSPDPIPHTPI